MKKICVVMLLVCFVIFSGSLVLGNEAFFELVKTGSPEEVRRAIEAGAELEVRDVNGWTPLMAAAANNSNPDVVRVLWEAEVGLEAREAHGRTPLMRAADFNQNSEVVRVLLEAEGAVKVRDVHGKTTFDHAQDSEHLKGTEVYWLLNEARFLIKSW